LAALYGVFPRHIKRIRNGSPPPQNGLGARPWELHNLEQLEQWHARHLAKGKTYRRRALDCIDKEGPIGLKAEPTEKETLSLEPGPGSPVAVQGSTHPQTLRAAAGADCPYPPRPRPDYSTIGGERVSFSGALEGSHTCRPSRCAVKRR
jgi:hypothetical protein